MSHRKFNAPRRGSLAFLPRGRARHVRGRVRSWPKDDPNQKPSMQAFVGFKAGMTHVMREVTRPGSRLNKKSMVEAVTILETPPVIGVGIIGYKETVDGLKPVTVVWASFVSEEVKRRYYRNYARARKAGKGVKAFSSVKKTAETGKMAEREQKIIAEADVVRIIVHTQPQELQLGAKKAEVVEVQINGGSTAEKVRWGLDHLEQKIRISDVFQSGDMADLVSVGKGKGWEGVIHRYGAKLLQKKTHRGRRKVACIGPWNPRRVSWAVARAGSSGFRKRTELGKRLYRVWAPKDGDENAGGQAASDLTVKSINPMGGFVRYGEVKGDFVMVKGSVCGSVKRVVTIRKPIRVNHHRIATEEIGLRWIDTSSKFGHGRFQTKDERRRFLGKLKQKNPVPAQ